MSRIRVGKIPFAVTSLPGAVAWTLQAATTKEPQSEGVSIRLANAYCVAIAENDNQYATLMQDAGVNFPDGSPVAWAMKWATRSTGDSPERVRGPSFFTATLAASEATQIRHFFLGTTQTTLDSMRREILRVHPRLKIAGMSAPAFSPVTSTWADDISAEINAANPDIVWVALGTPKQDFASTLIAERTKAVCVGVGAAFDFMAGTTREAPKWMQSTGLEWLFRMTTEPRRLWRRYLVGNLVFAFAIARRSRESQTVELIQSDIDLRVKPEASSLPHHTVDLSSPESARKTGR